MPKEKLIFYHIYFGVKHTPEFSYQGKEQHAATLSWPCLEDTWDYGIMT